MNPTWNRRTFLTALGLTTAATTLPAATLPDASSAVAPAPTPARPVFAFVSMLNAQQGGVRSINTYRIDRTTWTEILYPFETFYPNALAAHPTLPVLYTASNPQSGPGGDARRGLVSAIRIADPSFISVERTFERSRHWLNEINRQPLALATTRPSHIAVSPHGDYLLVADAEGGHYNLLPIAADGSLLPVEHVLKQTGSGAHASPTASHPHSVLFHPNAGIAYTTDAGTDHLSLLSLTSSPKDDHPRITDRLSFPAGSGPAHLSLHPSASFLLVTSQLRPAIFVIPLDPQTGAFSDAVSHLPLPGSGLAGPTHINAAGTLVYAISSSGTPSSPTILSTLRLSRSGRLTLLSRQSIPHLSRVAALTLHRSDLLLVGQGGVVTLPLDVRTGLPGHPAHVVTSGNMTGIVLRTTRSR